MGCNGDELLISVKGPREVRMWSDSDWAGERKTRKSVDCVVTEVLGAVVGVTTKGQAAVAQSSAEAELGGAHRAALVAVGVQNLWSEIFDEVLPIRIMMDSAAGKVLGCRRGRGRVRHLEVKQLYLQHLVNANRVQLVKVRGECNKADVGTKPMNPGQVEKFYGWLDIVRPADNKQVSSLMDKLRPRQVTACVPQWLQALIISSLMTESVGTFDVVSASRSSDDGLDDTFGTVRSSLSWYARLLMFVLVTFMVAVCGLSYGMYRLWRLTRELNGHVTATERKLKDALRHNEDLLCQVEEARQLVGHYQKQAAWDKADRDKSSSTSKRLLPESITIAPSTGMRYHTDAWCEGLRTATCTRVLTPCTVCWAKT
jgi:hypothetical protein